MAYLTDLLDLTNSTSFDEGVFQTYQSLGRSLVNRTFNHEDSSKSRAALMKKELGFQLESFSTEWKLYTGLAMEEIWATLKPPTATSMSQLDTCLEIEALADRFDSLKWRSGASLRELGILRNSLVAVHALVDAEGTQTPAGLENVKKALDDAERQSLATESDAAPFFLAQFDILAQVQSLGKMGNHREALETIDILADRPTKDIMSLGSTSPGWETLSLLGRISGGSETSSELAAVRRTLPVSTLHKLREMSEVSLGSLSLLTVEVDVLSQRTATSCSIISVDPVPMIHNTLLEMKANVLRSLESQGDPELLERYIPQLSHLAKRLDGINLNQRGAGYGDRQAHLEGSVSGLVKASLRTFKGQNGPISTQMADDWIQFFAGLLLLYVPDKPFDPALRPYVERDRHKKRTAELQHKLDALQIFENAFSGQGSSYRIQMIRQNLDALGAEPSVPPILRPASSQLSLLQGEFNNILKSIVLRVPNSAMLEAATEGDSRSKQEIEILRVNIDRAVSRLSGDFRAYDDIVKPAIAMLQGVDIGLSLAVLAGTQKTAKEEAIAHVCDMTPFMGATSSSLISHGFNGLENISSGKFDPRPLFLQRIALARSVEHDLAKGPMRTMLETFHSFYREWKERLDQDQKDNAAKSSLYRYRGSEEDNDELDREDFQQLFPAYDGDNDSDTTTHKRTQDPKFLAQRLSHLHREIFFRSQSPEDQILIMIETASDEVARLWPDDTRTSTSPVAPEKLLSGLILNLDKAKENLQTRSQQHELYNFYTDSNMVEAQKIVTLVQKIQSRFRELQEALPEHATLEDVLRVSKELLSLRHSEAVAKILTKTEQLHGYVHEWQTVASREHTAITLYDQLTDLLVSWRRLELSTWGRLLDMEDKHCKDDSDSWWFIAYEVIIAVPMSMIDSQESIGAYAEQLFGTLENFLATTSCGQYNHRLYLIKCLEDHIAILAVEHGTLRVIRNALANFLRYYHRYNGSIQESLHQGRQKLEKDMKEILLLASWKDTNIVALRDSAKRSHHKLFKIVRKYRTLLAQPTESIIRQGMTDPQSKSNSEYLAISITAAPRVDTRAIDLCQQKLSGWDSKPVRLTKPDDTAQNMLRISQLPHAAIDGAAYLDTFASDLVENIKILQKETSTKSTMENGEAIKHLKSRKRKLYSETLKSLRQMGFQCNLSADVLKKQDSVAAVLSSSPVFGVPTRQDLLQADHYFDLFLQIMPQTREIATKHSEDLSHGEAARSIGYLESILSIVVKQREVLAGSVGDLADFEATCEIMKNLWDPDSYTIRLQNAASEKSETERRHVTSWLPSILDVGCVILEKCSRLRGSDSLDSLAALKDWRGQLGVLGRVMNGLPKMPIGVSSSSHAHVFGPENTELDTLRDRLNSYSEKETNSAFVFKQIRLWLKCDTTQEVHQTNGAEASNPSQIDDSISKAVDSILVAMQHVGDTLSSVPSTDEDAHWLVHMDTSLSNSLRSLHVKENKKMLQDAMSQLQHLETSNHLLLASAICAVAFPIVQQYQHIQKTALERYASFHLYLCRLASTLAVAFSKVAQEGFCSPTESSAAKDKTTEKVEGGTGLGEGEGAEDISKDIQDDEDLSELAQQGKKEDDKEEIEDEEDAVNMDHDELEGEMGDAPENSGGEDDASDGGDGNDIEDETGDVDDLDPGAIDEKLWDGKGKDADKDKEGDNEKGEASKDKSAAAESEKKNADDGEKGNEEVAEEENVSEYGADESEEVAREENEKMDKNVEEGQNLDLPEEMDLDDADGSQGSQSPDSHIDDLSDIDAQDEEGIADQMDDDADAGSLDGQDVENAEPQDDKDPEKNEETAEEGSRVGSPVDTEPEDDDQEDKEGLLQERTDDAAIGEDNTAITGAQGLGQDMDKAQNDDQKQENKVQGSKGAKGAPSGQDDDQAVAEDGETSNNPADAQAGQGEDDCSKQEQSSQAFKKLGDALEKWHKQQRNIQEATNPNKQQQQQAKQESSNIKEQDFEHLGDHEHEAATQALGAASNEQARPLDGTSVDSEMQDEPRTFAPDDADEEGANEEDHNMEDAEGTLEPPESPREQSRPSAFVGIDPKLERQAHQPSASNCEREESVKDLDTELLITHLGTHNKVSTKSMDEARRLWAHHEAITRDLSLFLTERLRLILAPTLATKMRGDFRTGKRLNIKRIIPYIASNFKRDKIWMRRSIPSKRNYQIMLAVDDSKSMSESGSGQLAYQTLALVAKSLSMLEVGEICIVGFGNDVFVAHEFDAPFSSEAGASAIQRFGFQQNVTNVRKLVEESIRIFRQARLKQSSASTDLWQLELIISDGVCEDHETIKRLVRQASEEHIMIVFVIVDALLKEESIVDMSEARFETDPITGESKLNIARYLDGFPFAYYLVVGDVRELPGVLAQALRQWFAEVVGSG